MPRTGGDYIFVSRTLSAPIGFVASVVLNLFVIFSVGSVFATIAPQYLAAVFAAVGIRSHNAGLLNVATTLSSPAPTYLIGIGCILAALIVASLPLRTFTKVYAILLPFGALSLLLAVLVLATHTSAALTPVLKSFHSSYGKILSAAAQAGYHPGSGFNLGADFAATPVVFGFMGFGFTAAYLGGEIRRPSSTVTRAYLSAIGIGVVGLLLLLGFAAHSLGENWIGSATYIASADPKAYPFPAPPGIMLFASLLTSNTPLIIAMNGLLVLLIIVSQGPAFFLTTRSMVAWSFDRVMPAKLSEVNERTHSPLITNFVLFLVYCVICAVLVWGPSTILQLAFGALLGQLPIFLLVSLVAIVIPWRRQALYNLAPISRRKIFGLPAISVVGGLAFASYAFFFEQYLTNNALGANSPVVFISFPIMLVVAVLMYLTSKWVNERRGVNLSVAFTELPPE